MTSSKRSRITRTLIKLQAIRQTTEERMLEEVYRKLMDHSVSLTLIPRRWIQHFKLGEDHARVEARYLKVLRSILIFQELSDLSYRKRLPICSETIGNCISTPPKNGFSSKLPITNLMSRKARSFEA